MEQKKNFELKLICSLIIIWAIPSFIIGGVLLIELFFANKLLIQINDTLIGLFAVSMGVIFFTISIGLLLLKTWAYKIIIALAIIYLILLIPLSITINLVYGSFNLKVIQHLVIPLVLNIWILTFFTKKRVRNLYIKN